MSRISISTAWSGFWMVFHDRQGKILDLLDVSFCLNHCTDFIYTEYLLHFFSDSRNILCLDKPAVLIDKERILFFLKYIFDVFLELLLESSSIKSFKENLRCIFYQ